MFIIGQGQQPLNQEPLLYIRTILAYPCIIKAIKTRQLELDLMLSHLQSVKRKS